VFASADRRAGKDTSTVASTDLHEPEARLDADAIDRHRAVVSVMEELEAVDWYHQRSVATEDAELRALLEHNRDEEKEHASMLLEWLRRRDAKLDEHLQSYLFTAGSIVGIEREAESDGDDARAAGGDLGIGSLRPEAAS
jgi:ferritin-like protein